MSYTLYIANNCHDCAKVEEYVKSHGIEATIINYDKAPEVDPPLDIVIFPALFCKGDLKAYGMDIVDYLQKSPICQSTDI